MNTPSRAVLTAVLYLLAARYSIFLQDLTGLGAVFWPGAGITVASLLLAPRRAWPAILVAVAGAEIANDLWTGSSWASSVWWAAANVIEPLLAAWLIQRWGAVTFGDVRRALLIAVAVFTASGLGALVGSVGTPLTASQPYVVTAGQWFVGDGLGMLTIVPFALVVGRRIGARGLRSVEGTVALAAVVSTSLLVFGTPGNGSGPALDYLILLPMVWAAVRFGVAGAAVALFVTAQIGNLAFALGRGAFVTVAATEVQSAAGLQLFLAAVGITCLLLASRTAESAAFHDLAQTREQLIAAVSHELRTPLTPIVGFSELLLTRNVSIDDEARRSLETIQRNGLHLAELVEDLLLASRARHDNLAVNPEPIQLRTFVGALVEDRADVRLEMSDGGGEVIVDADRTHVRQVLTNLLDNALRYGAPPVEVAVTRSGRSAVVSVTDRGEGVPPWFVPRLFDAFAQADRGAHRARSGLGLPIARGLARANGGDLAYRPIPGGASFVLTLPLASGAERS